MSFDINDQNVMMTWPNTGKLDMVQILQRLRFTAGVVNARILICEERYSNSSKTHFHALVFNGVKKRWTMKELDAAGGIHGHYQRITHTEGKAIAYCAKDNNFFAWPPSFRQNQVENAIRQYGYRYLSGEKSVEVLRRDLANNGSAIGHNFQKKSNKLKGAPNKRPALVVAAEILE